MARARKKTTRKKHDLFILIVDGKDVWASAYPVFSPKEPTVKEALDALLENEDVDEEEYEAILQVSRAPRWDEKVVVRGPYKVP